MWNDIVNLHQVELSIILDNKSEFDQIAIFLGAQWELPNRNVYDKFVEIISHSL